MDRVLLFACENWLGPAYLPRVLQEAGAWVGLSSPPNTYIAQTKFRDQHIIHGTRGLSYGLFGELSYAIKEMAPNVIVFADELSLATGMDFLTQAPALGADANELALVADSLPPQWTFDILRSKRKCLEFARSIGIRVPASRQLSTVGDALQFAEEVGYPVLLKPEQGSAGRGISTCLNEDDLVAAASQAKGACTIDQFIDGADGSSTYVGVKGKVVAAAEYVKVNVWPEPYGPASTIEILDLPEVREFGMKLLTALEFNGLCIPGFRIDPEGRAWFIELNGRLGPIATQASRVGWNPYTVWLAARRGEPVALSVPPHAKVAYFPQERCRTGMAPVGFEEWIPTDDPLLLNAFNALLHGNQPEAELPQAS